MNGERSACALTSFYAAVAQTRTRRFKGTPILEIGRVSEVGPTRDSYGISCEYAIIVGHGNTPLTTSL